MKLKPIDIADQILDALANDYAGIDECGDHANKSWRKLFEKADKLGLLDDDLLEAMMVERLSRLNDANLCLVRPGVEQPAPRPCSFLVDGTAAVLTVGNLDSTEASDLLAAHADEARAAKLLAIDLRGCAGGLEQAAYPLLNWLFDADTNLDRLLAPQKVLTNYSQGNCEARETQITQLKQLIGDAGGADTTAWLDQSLDAVKRNRNKGYVLETAYPASMPVVAGPVGQKVAILTDAKTADAAEWLARTAKASARCTQVGEATHGNLDYSNPVSLSFDDRFVFVYPMSKSVEAAEGRGIRLTGIVPEVRCPSSEALEQAKAL